MCSSRELRWFCFYLVFVMTKNGYLTRINCKSELEQSLQINVQKILYIYKICRNRLLDLFLCFIRGSFV